MRAFLKNNRQAPRKVRLIARSVVGKRVDMALAQLSQMPHKASKTMSTLIASAFANAKQEQGEISAENFLVKNITVDKGITHVRYMPRAFGRASPIHRESSHVRVTLARIEGKEKVLSVEPVAKETQQEKESKNTTDTKEVKETVTSNKK